MISSAFTLYFSDWVYSPRYFVRNTAMGLVFGYFVTCCSLLIMRYWEPLQTFFRIIYVTTFVSLLRTYIASQMGLFGLLYGKKKLWME